MIRTGLCSVTFRQLAPEQIVPLAADAGLEVIEWGGDLHVPPGDPERAAQIAELTADAGLAVCSYGSYFRAGADEALTPILDSAQALGADRVRVWAGSADSADAAPAVYAQVVSRLQDAVAEASARDIALALEFHRGTLADNPDAVLRLLADIGAPALQTGAAALSTYWQPSVGADDDTALAEFDAIAAHTSAAHVFSWWPKTERLRLDQRGELWRRFFDAAKVTPPRDALLEFVVDDDPALLASEAAALRAYARRAHR